MNNDPTANREFAELAKRFHFFAHNSKDRQTEVTKKYSFRYSHPGFLFLDSNAEEFARIEKPSSFQFDETVVLDIERIESEYWQSQTMLVEYLSSMLKSTKADPRELSLLVEQLASDKFAARQNAESKLLQLGNCSHGFLADAKTNQPESRKRIKRILEQLDPLKEIVLREELARNVPFLARHFEEFQNIELRLQSVLPDVDSHSAKEWWQEHGDDYQWDQDTDRYVPIQK